MNGNHGSSAPVGKHDPLQNIRYGLQSSLAMEAGKRGCGVKTDLIGLIGGLGPAATIRYYEGILSECDRRKLQPRILINHADVARVLDMAARDEREALAHYLAERVSELERAGATVIAISAVTPHICMENLVRLTQLQIVDLIDATNTELQRKRLNRIALLGTRSVMASRLFGRLGATVEVPPPEQVTQIHELYLSIVKSQRVDASIAKEFGSLALELRDNLSVEGIVLAGTELSLVPEEAWGDVAVVDCSKLHIEAIVQKAMEPKPFTQNSPPA